MTMFDYVYVHIQSAGKVTTSAPDDNRRSHATYCIIQTHTRLINPDHLTLCFSLVVAVLLEKQTT